MFLSAIMNYEFVACLTAMADPKQKCNSMRLVLVQDNPDLCAVMEKTRLVIFHGLEPEVRKCFALCILLCSWYRFYIILFVACTVSCT